MKSRLWSSWTLCVAFTNPWWSCSSFGIKHNLKCRTLQKLTTSSIGLWISRFLLRLQRLNYQLTEGGGKLKKGCKKIIHWVNRIKGLQIMAQNHVLSEELSEDGWRRDRMIRLEEINKWVTSRTSSRRTKRKQWDDQRSSSNWPGSCTLWRRIKGKVWDDQMKRI